MKSFWRFASSRTGATAIEYALIASLIALAIITSVTLLGENTGAVFQSLADELAEI